MDDDLPPPPPVEDSQAYNVFNPIPNIEGPPPPMRTKLPPTPARRNGPPPVTPRINKADTHSIEIKNNLLFKFSGGQTTNNMDSFAPPSQATQRKESDESSLALMFEEEKMSRMPHLTLVDGQREIVMMQKPNPLLSPVPPPKEKPVASKSPYSRQKEAKLPSPFPSIEEAPIPPIKETEIAPPVPIKQLTRERKKPRQESALPPPPEPIREEAEYSSIDKKIFDYINQVRTQPRSFIRALEDRINNFEKETNNYIMGPNTKLVTYEGIKAVEEAIEFLEKLEPLNKLFWKNKLKNICEEHVNEVGGDGLYGHKMKDGNQPTDLAVKRLENEISSTAVSISFGKDKALEVILGLIIDDGVETRGNRNNLFGEWDQMGCFSGVHKISNNMTTILFVQSATKSQDLLEQFLKQVNKETVDPEGWAQKQQKVLFSGVEFTVTNIYTMRDGTQKTIEVKRQVKDKQLI